MSQPESSKPVVQFNPQNGFEFHDIDSMFRAADCFLQSGFAPPSFKTPQQLVICWARAAELGIRPLQAIDGMNVINGKLGIGGDMALAKVRSTGLLVQSPEVEYSGTGDDYTCTVGLHRKGDDEPRYFSFSIREAKQAGIYLNNWPKYPRRMTYYRALGFGLRDLFSDVLKGMVTSEELADYTVENDVQKVASNQEHDREQAAAGVKFVPPSGGLQPTPAAAVEPAFPEDTGMAEEALRKDRPAFSQQLKKDFPQPSPPAEDATEVKDDLDMTPAQAAAERPGTGQTTPVPGTVSPKDKAPEPARPAWMDHIIKSIPHQTYYGKKIIDLDAKALARIETQWMPKIQQGWEDANEQQRDEYGLFGSAIAYYKVAMPR
jgi:hypothetical protein